MHRRRRTILQRSWDGSYIVNYGAGLLPFRLYLHPLRANAEPLLVSYQRISKPFSQILLSSIRYPSLRARQHRHPRTHEISHLLDQILLEYSPRFHTRLILQRALPIRRTIRPERTQARGRRSGREVDSGVLPSCESRTPRARAKRIVGPWCDGA